MAGEWIKMRRDLSSDPAVIRIRRAVGLDVDTVVGKLHRLWSWADVHTIDGTAEGLDLEWIDETAAAPGFGAAMVAAGWLEVTDAGVRFSNFDRHNGQPAKVRALAKTRMQRVRCADSATEAQPEKRREEKRREIQKPTSSVPTSKPRAASSPGPKVSWDADAGWTGISGADRREWSEAFPGAVIDQELAKATAWLRANPKKAGKRNWRRFLVGWLQRCQDRGGSSREPANAVPRVIRLPRPDLGGAVLSDEEYARERRRMAQQAVFRREREQAMRERAEGVSLGEALERRVKVTEEST